MERVYGHTQAESTDGKGEGHSGRFVDLAVDAPQQKFGKTGGGEHVVGEWFGINHVLKPFHQTEIRTGFVEGSSPECCVSP